MNLLCFTLSAQQSFKRLNFILLIDNDVAKSNVNNGCFIIKDSTGRNIDSIHFEYQVGALVIKNQDYDKFRSINLKSQVFIVFSYRDYILDHDKLFNYKCKIAPDWLNDIYIILRIYNYSNIYSRKRYEIAKHSYRFIVEVPGHENVIPERKQP